MIVKKTSIWYRLATKDTMFQPEDSHSICSFSQHIFFGVVSMLFDASLMIITGVVIVASGLFIIATYAMLVFDLFQHVVTTGIRAYAFTVAISISLVVFVMVFNELNERRMSPTGTKPLAIAIIAHAQGSIILTIHSYLMFLLWQTDILTSNKVIYSIVPVINIATVVTMISVSWFTNKSTRKNRCSPVVTFD